MSRCTGESTTPRRKVAALAASLTAVAASAPLLLRHTAPSDWTFTLLGAVVGVTLGIVIVLVIAVAKKRA